MGARKDRTKNITTINKEAEIDPQEISVLRYSPITNKQKLFSHELLRLAARRLGKSTSPE
jgi:diketogulonate reductase-like aldo/keto reductase